MPTLTRAPTYIEPWQVQPVSTGSEAFGASFGETLVTGPAGAADIFQRLTAAEDLTIGEKYLDPLFGIESRKLSPRIAPDDAKQRVMDAGLEGQVPLEDYPNGIRSDTLQILIDENLAKVKRQTILAQSDGWGAQVGGMLVGSVIDPVNVATAFIPVAGEARYARLLSKAGGMFGRAGVRAGVGALEGVVGAAVVEPLIYAGQQQWRNDYDAYDSMLNLAGGALFGAALHAGSGLVKDAFGRPVAPIESMAKPDEAPIKAAEVVAPEPVSYREAVVPNEFRATTKGGEWILRDVEAPRGTDFSEFGQVRQVTAFDGDKTIGTLTYANDGTPPTIEVDEAYRRKGVATSMVKLAKERGGVLGDPHSGIRGRGSEYRTEMGQAFRSQADEASVTLSPRTQKVEIPKEGDPFAPIRPVVAQMAPETQAAALRHAVAQDAQGRPVDVAPALLTDPSIRDTRGALSAAQSNQQWASAAPAAANEASVYVAERPQTTGLDEAKQQLADDQSRYKEIGGDPEAIEFEGVDVKQVQDAVKAATLCMMRNVA